MRIIGEEVWEGPQKSFRLTACLKYKCLLSFGFPLATHFSLKLSDLSLLDVEVCEHSLVSGL